MTASDTPPRDSPADPFEDAPAGVVVPTGEEDAPLLVDVGGFEGPLDLLLDLARRQKIDLTRISILALAEQYLAFIEQAKRLRLELAADYLLMAAWLAYLKSRLLLPDPPGADEPSGEDLADALAERLRRLAVIRTAGEMLMARPRMGVDLFARGCAEAVPASPRSEYDADLIDLLKAYATQRARHALARVSLKRRAVWSLADARAALERLIGTALDWTAMDAYLVAYLAEPGMRATVLASSFATSLELAREGTLELRQDGAFGALYLRRREPPAGESEASDVR